MIDPGGSTHNHSLGEAGHAGCKVLQQDPKNKYVVCKRSDMVHTGVGDKTHGVD